MGSKSKINLEEILETHFMGDWAIFASVAQSLVDSTPRMLSSLDEAFSRGNAKDIREAAHRIKGAISSFQLGEAFELSTKLEEAAKGGAVDECKKIHPAFVKTVNLLTVEVGKILSSRAAA